MNCNEVQLLMADLADGSLDDVTRREIEAHISGCEACAAEWAETSELFRTIQQTPLHTPGPALHAHFMAMLEAERKVMEAGKASQDKKETGKYLQGFFISPFWKAAAACLLLVTGVWIGTRINRGPAASEMAKLENEVKNLHETLMISMLDNESASERLKAVNYAEAINTPNTKVINALMNTLNNDKNVNVRLAALYSISRFSNSEAVRDSLVASLSMQTEPIIQVVLINLLAEKKETKAIPSIKQILSNDKTLKEVKDAARKGLKEI